MAFRISTGLRNALMNDAGFKAAMEDGIIEIYAGPQPANADAAETGTKLVRITKASGAFVAGVATNGLTFATAPVAGTLSKSDDVWSGVGLADGVAGWYRFYANDYGTGASTTAIRFDGACATANTQLNMSTTSIKTGVPVTVDSAEYTMPSGA